MSNFLKYKHELLLHRHFDGQFEVRSHIHTVGHSWNPARRAGGFVNVLIGLALMYVNLAIYGYLYGIVESLTAWVANPSLPISMKNK
ncbi:MAG: hypothetical protein FJX91_08440 [Bacteroidetes bacterium]|nr:hypothetical protein [Bacteroidota bacterium]